TRPSWLLGKLLVRVPFYSMVNLIAGRAVVPELMQDEMTGERLAAEARTLLSDADARARMRRGLAEVREKLSSAPSPGIAGHIREILEGQVAHVS
ncbi:MAG TPA: lipid-A-disaccharide synthase, partial [Candidatus Sulfopaludibacter sp.]|nr:lipid-A-disaccharide synthase [Candidatus Sulfopaludibacter sp.]